MSLNARARVCVLQTSVSNLFQSCVVSDELLWIVNHETYYWDSHCLSNVLKHCGKLAFALESSFSDENLALLLIFTQMQPYLAYLILFICLFINNFVGGTYNYKVNTLLLP